MQAIGGSPGAWERHIQRRRQNPGLFDRPAPDNLALLAARQRDQREIEAFHRQLTEIIADLTSTTESAQLLQLKQRLDDCYRQSCALAGDLRDQQEALGNLNEIITTALRRALRDDDEAGRLQLIKHEASRLRSIDQWQCQLLADRAQTPSPIPADELAASLLCEPEAPMLAALQQFDAVQRRDIARQWHHLLTKVTTEDRELIEHRIALAGLQMPEEAINTG